MSKRERQRAQVMVAVDDHKRVIRDVWKHNLEEEMIRLRDIAEDYPSDPISKLCKHSRGMSIPPLPGSLRC